MKLSTQELGFGKCKLCVQAPVTENITDVKTLSGKRIVTSFPSVCKTYFDQYDTPDNPTSEWSEGMVHPALSVCVRVCVSICLYLCAVPLFWIV